MRLEDINLTRRFSNIQCHSYDLIIGKNIFHFEHGDMFFSDNRDRLFLLIPPFIRNSLANLFYRLGYSLFPRAIAKNRIGLNMNRKIKNMNTSNMIYVIGHTHVPEFDLENKFINTGAIIGNFISYLEIDNSGKPKLIKKVKNKMI